MPTLWTPTYPPAAHPRPLRHPDESKTPLTKTIPRSFVVSSCYGPSLLASSLMPRWIYLPSTTTKSTQLKVRRSVSGWGRGEFYTTCTGDSDSSPCEINSPHQRTSTIPIQVLSSALDLLPADSNLSMVRPPSFSVHTRKNFRPPPPIVRRSCGFAPLQLLPYLSAALCRNKHTMRSNQARTKTRAFPICFTFEELDLALLPCALVFQCPTYSRRI